LQDFEIQKKLGEGAFGQVFVVKRKLDNHAYALKKVKLLGMKDKEK
jgi:serine/threonine protein kinase